MGGPPGRRSLLLGPSPPPLLMRLLLLLLVAVPSPAKTSDEKQPTDVRLLYPTASRTSNQDTETVTKTDGLSRLPAEALTRLQTTRQTLPAAFYQFTGIAIGLQRYPAAARFATVPATSACHCRHRCLAESRCLGYEHEAASGACGLTDVLLPAAETLLIEAGWSTGRRRGASWLAQPCATDADCSLLVDGAVYCGQQEASRLSICSCRPGWQPAGPLACRLGGRWVALTSTLLTGQPLRQHQQPTLADCQQTCARAVDCWAMQFSGGECLQFGTAEQGPAPQTPLTELISYVWQFDREEGSPPAGYTELAGSWLMVTGKDIPGSGAALACLELGGIQYVAAQPEALETVYTVYEAQAVGRFGIGANDMLKQGRFITINGDVIDGEWWAMGQPGNVNENCVGVGWGGWQLHDIGCDYPIKQMCEFVGEDLLSGRAGVQHQPSSTDQITVWWTYDLGAVLQVSRVLYVAGQRAAAVDIAWTELRVGSEPAEHASAAVCRRLEGTFVAAGSARRFSCHVPLAGRYLHVRQLNGMGERQWERVVVFGNRYENSDKGGA